MSTWEERMSLRSKVRTAEQQAAAAREPTVFDEHRTLGHHLHLNGTAIECSCGAFFGVTCVAFDDDYDPQRLSCSTCGAVGVVQIPW